MRRSVAVLGALSAALAGIATTGTAPVAAAPAPTSRPPAAQPAGEHRQVTLVTGDVVALSTRRGGLATVTVVAASHRAPSGAFQGFNAGEHLYVVPQSAAPYLGTTLSPALFDVSRLAGSPTANDVRVSYRSAADTDVPGITVTKRSGDTATGEVTSPRAFGRALARQWRHDHDRAQHTTGLFANVANIAPAGAAAPPVRPDFPMRTLTIRTIDSAGEPDNGTTVLLRNVDDMRKYSATPRVTNGLAKVSVPTGHYSGWAFFYDGAALRVVALPQFTVRDARTVTFDARTATSPMSIETPQPTDMANDRSSVTVQVGRTDALGSTATYFFQIRASTRVLVHPTTRPPSVGALHYFVNAHLVSPAGASTPYTYDLRFPSDGTVPAGQQFVVRTQDLAAVEASYASQSADRPGVTAALGALPWQPFAAAPNIPITTPIRRTEYYTARPDLSWKSVFYTYFTFSPFQVLGHLEDAWRTYRPGARFATTWAEQPAHPRLQQNTGYQPGVTICPACRTGSTLSMLVYPLADSDPDHFGVADNPTTDLTESVTHTLYADDVPIASGGFLNRSVSVPAGTRRLRIDYDMTRSHPTLLTLSTQTHTSWSVRTRTPLGPLPDGWICAFGSTSTDCGVLPLLTASYQLPVDELGRIASGPTQGRVHVGHLLGSAALTVAKIGVKVSFDGGDHWSNAAVDAAGNGQYSVAFTVPDTGDTDGYGAIQLTAKDAAGGTLTQTIQHAFAVAAP